MGVMVYGGVQQARYSLSEISMFSGSRYDGADRKEAVNYLPKIRHLLLQGRNVEAEQLTNQHFTWSGEGANAHYGTYQGLGTLTLDFAANAAPVSDYRRRLDIPSATSDVRYTQDGVRYRREMFVSAPDQVMVLHLSADRAGALNFVARLDRAERASVEGDGANGLLMRGELDSGGNGKGLAFAARVRVIAPGASVHADAHGIRVEHGTDVTVLISEATDYDGFAGRHTTDPVAASATDLQRVASHSVAQLHAVHVADFSSWFDRFSLQLGSVDNTRETMSTRARLDA
jgi:alpha-L-fucosidase 2